MDGWIVVLVLGLVAAYAVIRLVLRFYFLAVPAKSKERSAGLSRRVRSLPSAV